MCDKRSSVILKLPDGRKIRVDSCLREKILQLNKEGKKTVACCCGHGIYPETIVFENTKVRSRHHYLRMDEITVLLIPRKRNFYKKDEDGFYYIPEYSQKKCFGIGNDNEKLCEACETSEACLEECETRAERSCAWL